MNRLTWTIFKLMRTFEVHVMVLMTVYPCRNACHYSIKQQKPVTQAIDRYIVEYLNMNPMFVAHEIVSKKLMLVERIWYRGNIIKAWEHSHLSQELDLKVSSRHLVHESILNVISTILRHQHSCLSISVCRINNQSTCYINSSSLCFS